MIAGSNKIKSVNGIAFSNLQLRRLELLQNVCIDAEAKANDDIQTLSANINENCGFFEDTSQIEKLLNVDCGKTDYNGGLIYDGSKATRGQWPFSVALFKSFDNQFFCAGTLISSKNI